MPFVYEKVSEHDIERYKLREIDLRYLREGNSYWTYDREANIYLREMGINWQDPGEKTFAFYWKGRLMMLVLRSLSFVGRRGGKGHQIWGLSELNKDRRIPLPVDLEPQRDAITRDLKAALLVYKGGNSYSKLSEYTAEFEF